MKEQRNKFYQLCRIVPVILLLGLAMTGCKGKTLQLNGNDVYSIIYDEDCSEEVEEAGEKLQEYLGSELTLIGDETAETSKYEILIGNTNRPESAEQAEGLGLYDYRVAIDGKKVVLAGGSDVAVINAIAEVIHSGAISTDDNGKMTISQDYSAYFDGADNRDEYVEDPHRFLCNWAIEFDVPDWLLDFDEKIAAMNDPDGRMMSSIHRSDFVNYPENSLESVISSIKMGADNIELDISKTRDNVVILFHDPTLSSKTDWKEKAGKNGLPTSDKVVDWTYEELTQLRLLTLTGEKTDYIIPTFEEVLQVCNERITIRMDKTENWNWDADIYPLIKKTGAWRVCIPNPEFGSGKQLAIWEQIKEDSNGVLVPMWFVFGQTNGATWQTQLDSYTKSLDGNAPMMRIGMLVDYKGKTEDMEPYLSQIKDKARICIEMYAGASASETPKAWDYVYEKGINWVLVDNGLKFQKYIAENYEPTPY